MFYRFIRISIYLFLFFSYSFVILRGCTPDKMASDSYDKYGHYMDQIRSFLPKKLVSWKNVLSLRPNLSCRKQKTNPPKIGTSLQIPWMFPPAPLGIAPDACFLKSGFSGSRASGAIPRGAGENIHGIWRDVPIFGGFVFCFLQFARPTKTSFF